MDDLIDRQAAIDALRTCYDTETVTYTNGNEYIDYDQALDLLNSLPTVQPEPSIPLSWIEKPVIHAHWISCENETGEGSNTYKCSACGEIQMIISGTPKENGWKYCPHCGAKME